MTNKDTECEKLSLVLARELKLKYKITLTEQSLDRYIKSFNYSELNIKEFTNFVLSTAKEYRRLLTTTRFIDFLKNTTPPNKVYTALKQHHK